MRASLGHAIEIFDAGILLYFLAINTLYLGFSIVSFFLLIDHRRRSGDPGHLNHRTGP